MFRRRLLMQQAMSVPDPIAAYDPTGHTNEDMAEYPVLTDLTGNGHDISCNDFAWSGMSGIGGYHLNFSNWSSDNSSTFDIEKYSNKVIFTNIDNIPGIRLNLYKTQNLDAINGIKFKVSGMEDGEVFRVAYKEPSGDDSYINVTNINSDGEVTANIPASSIILIYITNIKNKSNRRITIEQLPLYGNALVSDGVDDYGICENFPILTKEKGYTVVAVRKRLDSKFSLVSKRNSPSKHNGAFIIEYFINGDIKAFSFGSSSDIESLYNPDVSFIYQKSNQYLSLDIVPGNLTDSNVLKLFSWYHNNEVCSAALYSLEIYDRDLTPYQIEAVKKRLMDKYNNPEDTTSDWYGVEWYTNQSPSRVMRIGNVNLHKSLPIQSGMYRCILNDNGEEVYKLDPNDSTKKEDGTPAVLDGTDGQVMVYIPVFYARFESKGYRRRVKLSYHYKPGFIRMGGCYVSAYEATVDRTISTLIKLASVVNTTDNFRGGNNNSEWDSTYRSLLGMPATVISLTNFRNYARNRKDGDTQWNCMDYTAYKAVYWLYVVEYADRNCQLDFNENLTSDGFRQGGLGAGVTDIKSEKWNSFNSYYPFVPCGHTNSLGNKTGIVPFIMPFEYDAGGAANYAGAYDTGTPYTDGQFVSEGQDLYECIADAAAGTDLSDTTYFTHVPRTSTHIPSYRGIENIFGHLWKWTDGVHIKVQSEESGGKSILYTSDNPANYQDTGYEGYEEKGYVARANGYVRDIIFGRDGDFYVSEDGATGGSTTTYFSDNSYTNIPESGESLKGLLLGGRANIGSDAGLVYVYSYLGPSTASTYLGSRLCYIPNN